MPASCESIITWRRFKMCVNSEESLELLSPVLFNRPPNVEGRPEIDPKELFSPPEDSVEEAFEDISDIVTLIEFMKNNQFSVPLNFFH